MSPRAGYAVRWRDRRMRGQVVDQWMLVSPGGAVGIQVRLRTDGGLEYRVLGRDRPVVDWSRLGVARADQVFDLPLTVIRGGPPPILRDRSQMIHRNWGE